MKQIVIKSLVRKLSLSSYAKVIIIAIRAAMPVNSYIEHRTIFIIELLNSVFLGLCLFKKVSILIEY